MYLTHFGLTELPFELTANPRFLFLTPGHREALANLQYGLSTSKAITLMLGEAGTGKTTVLRAALRSDSCAGMQCVHLANPELTRSEFIEALARGFELSVAARTSKTILLAELESELRRRRSLGTRTALIVDEAQRLSDDLLEEIRLLANIETEFEKLLPLVLAGQPELAQRLNQSSMRQFKQRVALRCEIAPFTLTETAVYIATRIRIAGGEASRLFSRDAVMLVHEHSRGIPRTINVICDNALLNAYAAGRASVGREVVRETARDFDLAAFEGSLSPVDPATGAGGQGTGGGSEVGGTTGVRGVRSDERAQSAEENAPSTGPSGRSEPLSGRWRQRSASILGI